MLRLPAVALVLAIGTMACRPTSTGGPAPAESGAFVVTLGNDTLAIEQYTTTGNRLEGQLVSRVPRTVVQRYAVMLDASNRPTSFEHQARLPDGGLLANAPRSATVTFTADSVVTQVQRDTMVTVRAAARDAFPFVNYAVSLYAPVLKTFNALGRDSASFVTYNSNGQRGAMPIVRKGPNRYWLYVFGSPQEVTTDDRGRILSVDASRTTIKYQARRQSSADVVTLAGAFAQRERETRPAGPLSPRDTINATVGNAQLWIDYSRPMARGRRVFGANGVLGDTIWRTGANAATQFRTSVPIVVAGQTIPAGTYTLWTVAIPGRYQLIFNKQTGQWGTMYDPAQDLVRVPLQVSRAAQPLDRFTISVDPNATNGATLRLRWDDTELALPLTVP
jgi:DUF2911 family protein